jgi:protein-tyrosine kinase
MSMVFEALKKAEQERLAQNTADSNAPVAQSERVVSPPNLINDNKEFDRLPFRRADDNETRPAAGVRLNARATDEFQVLSTRIQEFAAGREKRVWAVASASAGEGKSFVALNLGLSLARAGRHVILVDADLRTPSLHKIFNLTPLRGLLDYLFGRGDFPSCLYKTPMPGLTLVPGGGSTGASSELFAGTRLPQFIQDAKASDPDALILFDLPPVLATPETQIISRLIDAIVMVVGANYTPRASVARALELIKGAEIAGAVLNRFEPPYSQRISYEYYKSPGKYNG